MLINLLVPANLDFQKLTAEQLPNYDKNKGGITAENLAYICHCIISQYFKYKQDYIAEKHGSNGFVPLHSTYLKKIVPQYANCIYFLTEHNVIECDNHFVKGHKSKGYKITKHYVSKGFQSLIIQDRNLIRHLKLYYQEKATKEAPIIKPLLKTRTHLENILKSPLFKIDIVGARKAAINAYHKKRKAANQLPAIEQNIKIAQANTDFSVIKETLKMINKKHFTVIHDTSGCRLHSPITRLPKYLRYYLTYDDKSLIALDVKNSQPYFSLALFNSEFYKPKKEKKQETLYLKQIDNDLYKLLLNKPIKLPKIAETISCIGLQKIKKYGEDVLSGILYDNFVTVPKGSLLYDTERQKVKKEFLTVMYNVPTLGGKAAKFNNVYPEVFDVFNTIKSVESGIMKRRPIRRRTPKPIGDGFKKDLRKYPIEADQNQVQVKGKKPKRGYVDIDNGYTKLATLLQRVESHLLLDVICYKLAKENPNIPLITIHDSIATTAEYVDYVEATIKETLTKYIGFPPKLEREYWSNPIERNK